jgi:Fe2+ or Zn2+ uptake regulation protein
MKKTKISTQVMAILESAKKPISVPELLTKCSHLSPPPNKTTLYRQMTTLLKTKKITAISLKNGTIHYELSKTHHHHFICESCQEIMCLPPSSISKDICNSIQALSPPEIQVKSHDFNLYGQCKNCL